MIAVRALLERGLKTIEQNSEINLLSLAAAHRIAHHIPNAFTDVSAGVDGDRTIFFKLQKATRLMYLTVESNRMHLLIMDSAQPNTYIDDVEFDDTVPEQIMKHLR